MLRIMCKSKIHRATITKVDLHYEGSIGIDKTLLESACAGAPGYGICCDIGESLEPPNAIPRLPSRL